ncbi:hypothetical protein [Sphingobacterium sp. SGL-16]|uniref:hypothetical protein n=1 Tax=Sphingobacterium sp. SGL-16 TaxID=2710883 RepID=UPI0013EA36D0|nr:hypothetical protein [Sphingobacterium sp. SGL-16]NGM74762.1 hypothetical protein [Sphingobacterium sp. SGL-16]
MYFTAEQLVYFVRNNHQELKNENIDPYYISSVTYGNESIFLAESDSTRQAFNKVYDKLIENSALDNADIAVLDSSNLLIYRRDSGSNTSFLSLEKGLRKFVISLKNSLC